MGGKLAEQNLQAEQRSSGNQDIEAGEETAPKENPPGEQCPLTDLSCSNGEVRGGADAGHQSPPRDPSYLKKLNCFKFISAVEFIIIIIGFIAALSGVKLKTDAPEQRVGGVAGCPGDEWVAFQGKCYYFSEAEGPWPYGQNNCSAFNASLAGIDTQEEKDFMLRYRGSRDHWIGLWGESGPPWRWVNGTEFNNWFHIGGGGECVYLKEASTISSSRCSMERLWICSKPQM